MRSNYYSGTTATTALESTTSTLYSWSSAGSYPSFKEYEPKTWKEKLIKKKPWCYYMLQNEHNIPEKTNKVESTKRLVSDEIIRTRNVIKQQSRGC